jgi:hypothetical protein
LLRETLRRDVRCLVLPACSGLILAIAFLLLLVFGRDGVEAQQDTQPQLYEGIPLDATLLSADKRALEEAYHQQLLLLFSVWLKGDISEDARIRNGLKKARAAYTSVAQQIAKREQELLERDQLQKQK